MAQRDHDNDEASDARTRALIETFLAAGREIKAPPEDALRAASSLLISIARRMELSTQDVVGLVRRQAKRYLNATPAELEAMGVQHVPTPAKRKRRTH